LSAADFGRVKLLILSRMVITPLFIPIGHVCDRELGWRWLASFGCSFPFNRYQLLESQQFSSCALASRFSQTIARPSCQLRIISSAYVPSTLRLFPANGQYQPGRPLYLQPIPSGKRTCFSSECPCSF
jgi:hypothetical protein